MKSKLLVVSGCLLCLAALASYLLAQPPSPPVLTVRSELKSTPDGHRLVQFRGRTDTAYRIESSDNLRDWVVVDDGIVGRAGWTKWVDKRPTAQTQRFYRVVPSEGATALAARRAPTASDLLLAALNNGELDAALSILRAEGVSESTLALLQGNLGTKPRRGVLNESFLKASIGLQRGGFMAREGLQAKASALDYSRPCWRAEPYRTNWQESADIWLAASGQAPIGFLNVRPGDTNLITLFKWYDLYAERLHSVVLNGEDGDNRTLKPDQFQTANQTLSGLYKLVKARKPDAFVWLCVEHQDSASDAKWLQSLSFKPDGLLIGNLTQFHSPFATVRDSYRRILGEEVLLMVSGFY